MPELPEVETNARNFARWTVGRRIVRVTPPPGTRETGGVSARAFVRRLTGRRVESVDRRGKWILVGLDEGALALHLGMTGKIARDAETPRFARATFELDDGSKVHFVDSRRFGKLYTGTREELEERKEIRSVGPDAFHIEADALAAALQKTTRTVKEAIMDQRVIAGVGNLYAAEALFRAGIHPLTKAKKVKDVPALLKAIRAALRQGLREHAGTDLPEYLEEGAPNPFFVYDRQGMPCRRCKTEIESMTIGGRVSAYCPRCQPLRHTRKKR